MDVDRDNPISEEPASSAETAADYDDVEAHGLREVAIGVTAAAIIGGGASAAIAGSPTSFHPGHAVNSAVAQAQHHIGQEPLPTAGGDGAARPQNLDTKASQRSLNAIEHRATRQVKHTSAAKVDNAAESVKRVAGFGKQIAKGETDIVHNDVEAVGSVLPDITH